MSEIFQIRTGLLGSNEATIISKDRFEQLLHAAGVLRDALAVEQKYEVLLKNYVDFEREILERLVIEIVHDKYEYFDFYENLLAYDIRLVNFLASAKLYADQAPRHIKKCLSDAGFDAARSLFSKEYRENASYRLMDALRNHVIHSSLPVHSASIGGEWIDLHGERYLEHTVALRLEKSKLIGDSSFKASVASELPDSVDLATAVRSYMGSLNTAHLGIRGLLDESVTASRSLISEAIDGYLGGNGNSRRGQIASGISAQRLEGGRIVESVRLLLEWDDVRLKLVQRNRKLNNLHRRHVTGRSGDKDALKGQPGVP